MFTRQNGQHASPDLNRILPENGMCGMSGINSEPNRWYTKPAVQDALLRQITVQKEAWVSSQNYNSPRPLVVRTIDDLWQHIPRKEPASIYASIENFNDPAKLGIERTDSLRVGWDLVIDVDSPLGIAGLEGAKHCTMAILDFLANYGLDQVRVKFSGKKGFHLIVDGQAFDCFGSQNEFIKAYPELPKQITKFIIAGLGQENKDEVKIDLQPFASRQLLRAAYSLHDETGLVSVPIADLKTFTLDQAKLDNAAVSREWFEVKTEFMQGSELLDHVEKWVQLTKPPRRVSNKQRTGGLRPSRNPPCVDNLLAEGFTKRLVGYRNSILYTVLNGIRRLNFNVSAEQLIQMNQRSESPCSDRELRYYIEYHLNRRREPYSFKCEIMQGAGLCVPDGCWLCRRKQ